MKFNKLKSIKMSLMIAESDINEENKTDYTIKASGKFEIYPDFYDGLIEEEKESLTEGLAGAMYSELLKVKNDEDTLGLWIDYNGKIFENSIKIQTLKDMKKLSIDEIEPVYEFFKMTLSE